jgi:hypothetical protein
VRSELGKHPLAQALRKLEHEPTAPASGCRRCTHSRTF